MRQIPDSPSPGAAPNLFHRNANKETLTLHADPSVVLGVHEELGEPCVAWYKMRCR